ncbi:MAG: LamG domain-containing protein [bacterium]|nr:LamG domain-containing protein [bacterium]
MAHSEIVVYKDLNAFSVFVVRATIGTHPFFSLNAFGDGAGNISIENLAKSQGGIITRYGTDDFYEVWAEHWESFVDENEDPLGVDEATTVNELNSIFTNSGSSTGNIPVITSNLTLNVNTGDPINYFVTADYGVTYEWETPPTGLSVTANNERNLIGTLTSDGTYTIDVTAVNYYGTDVETLTIIASTAYTNTKSVRFNNNDYCDATANTSNPLYRASNGTGSSDAWTIAFWVKNGGDKNKEQTILMFGGSDQNNEGRVHVSMNGKNNEEYIRLHYGTNNNYLEFETPDETAEKNVWAHVIITYDGGTTGSASGSINDYYSRFAIYIDGVSQTLNTDENNYGFSGEIVDEYFRLGRNGTSGNYLKKNSNIEELALWASDETANVSDIYNGGTPFDLTTLSSPPDHYWRMGDNDTFPTLSDNVGSLDFTMTNMSVVDIVNEVP